MPKIRYTIRYKAYICASYLARAANNNLILNESFLQPFKFKFPKLINHHFFYLENNMHPSFNSNFRYYISYINNRDNEIIDDSLG